MAIPSLYGYQAAIEVPEPTAAQQRLIRGINALIRRESKRIDLPETIDPRDIEQSDLRSTIGASLTPSASLASAAVALWGITSNSDNDPIRIVLQCTELGETNPVFSPIVRKLARSVSEHKTTIEVEDPGRSSVEQIQEIWESFTARVGWEDIKQDLVMSCLHEGGITTENVVGQNPAQVVDVEYRPHHLTYPQTVNGRIENADEAYKQFDLQNREIATYSAWQISDVNLWESKLLPRGIPHLAAVRDLVAKVLEMIRGMYQKFVLEGGAVEHINMPEADNWMEMENLVRENRQFFGADPRTLVRQLRTTGAINFERIFSESKVQNDGIAIDLFLELVFMAAGVSKEVMGYKGNLTINDMASIARENLFQTLSQIQKVLFSALRQTFDLELLLQGIDTSVLRYEFCGGNFKIEPKPVISQQAVDAGAVSLNEHRRACGLGAREEELFNVPGLKLPQAVAVEMAILSGAIEESDPLVELLRTAAAPPPMAADPNTQQPPQDQSQTDSSIARLIPLNR